MKMPALYTSNLRAKVISESGAPADIADAAVVGYAAQLRHMPEHRPLILLELPQIVRDYGAREVIHQSIYEEAAKLILEKFSFLGLNEIREAYRLWAAGVTDPKGAEMYGGTFNAGQLGRVLGAYCEHRKAVIGVYLREVAAAKEQAEDKARREKMQAQFEENFPRRIAEARQTMTDWREVPGFWYQAALDRGLFTITRAEALEILEEARELARLEVENEAEDLETSRRKLLLAVLESADDMEAKAKAIARKITVFRKLIL